MIAEVRNQLLQSWQAWEDFFHVVEKLIKKLIILPPNPAILTPDKAWEHPQYQAWKHHQYQTLYKFGHS